MNPDENAAAGSTDSAMDEAAAARMLLRNGVQSRGELHLLDALDHVVSALESLGYHVTVQIEGPTP